VRKRLIAVARQETRLSTDDFNKLSQKAN